MSDPIDATTPAAGATSPAFAELQDNLQYARGLIQGGRSLDRLKIGAFDVMDLYRAAWVQAVSALDHWVHREMYDRAVAIASELSADRPQRFLGIKVPMSLLEDVYHHSTDLTDVFREHLVREFGRTTYQQPDDIRIAFTHVHEGFGWPLVAAKIEVGDEKFDSAKIKERLTKIAWRRNAIAHSTDRDPITGKRTPLGHEETTEAIDWIERIATAIIVTLGPMPQVKQPPKPLPSKKKWQRVDVEAAAMTAGLQIEKVVHRLLDHADENKARFNGGVGAAPSAGLYYPTRNGPRSLFSLYMTPDRPSISLNFALVTGVDPAIARGLIDDLRQIPAINDALINDDEDLLRRYPTLYLAALTDSDEALDGLMAAFDRVVDGWS